MKQTHWKVLQPSSTPDLLNKHIHNRYHHDPSESEHHTLAPFHAAEWGSPHRQTGWGSPHGQTGVLEAQGWGYPTTGEYGSSLFGG